MRTVCWFSCGAASAVATKLTLQEEPEAIVVYCKVQEEHPDNDRFLKDCEKWFGRKVQVIMRERYKGSIYEVFRQTNYLVGPMGARCSLELKKRARRVFQQPDDVQVFGYTSEEQERVDRFIDANPEVMLQVPLIEKNLSKSDCLGLIDRAGIEIPMMYKLGYANNNCCGCVKGGAGYWNKIRVDFPEMFERMAQTERLLGRQMLKRKGKRIYLDQLPPDAGNPVKDMPAACSFNCEFVELESLPLDGDDT